MLVNVRILPGETAEGTLAALCRKVNDPRVSVTMQQGLSPSGVSKADGAAFDALTRAIVETYPGVLVAPYLMIAASDARHYESVCPCVYRFSGMALSRAERKMIHGVDERIPVTKLTDTVRFFMRLIVNSVSNA
jgi:carboxypeptidase PM20D1